MGAAVRASASDCEYSVRQAECNVKAAEDLLRIRKESRDTAKKNGNYKNSSKCYRRADGKVGNVYDTQVWDAEASLKDRKKQLADAKKRLAEAKKNK